MAQKFALSTCCFCVTDCRARRNMDGSGQNLPYMHVFPSQTMVTAWHQLTFVTQYTGIPLCCMVILWTTRTALEFNTTFASSPPRVIQSLTGTSSGPTWSLRPHSLRRHRCWGWCPRYQACRRLWNLLSPAAKNMSSRLSNRVRHNGTNPWSLKGMGLSSKSVDMFRKTCVQWKLLHWMAEPNCAVQQNLSMILERTRRTDEQGWNVGFFLF